MSISPLSSRPISSPTTAHPASRLPSTMTLAPFLQSSLSIQGSQNSIASCLKSFFKLLCAPFVWLMTCCSRRASQTDSKFTKLIAQKRIDPNAFPHNISNPNKIFAYNTLVRGRSLGGPIDFLKYAIKNKVDISSFPLQINVHAPRITSAQGPISYEERSPDNATDWYANFADSRIMGFCSGSLYAQDEHQVSEFPALYHVYEALNKSMMRYMNSDKNEICLMKNVLHLGSLDTQTPLANGRTLYGHQFANASYADILFRLTLSNPAQPKNIFFFAAPHISSPAGQPYQKQHLEELFYTAFTAFSAAKQNSTNGRALMHTGNWGAGAFGNGVKTSHLIQIAAAYAASVDVKFYPLDKIAEFQAAQQLFNQIIQQNPTLSIGQFLTHLTQHAQEYGLVYGQGNGT